MPQPPDTSALSGLRAALRGTRPLVGTFVMIPRVEVVEMAAAAGFDAVIVDLEHGLFGPAELTPLVAAAQGAGIFALARIGGADPADIGRALDSGVDGLVVPHVDSAEAAVRVVAAGRFPTAGERSLNPYVRGTGYGDPAGPAEADRRVALLAMLEGEGALGAVDDICAVEGLDALFVGPVDLSGALGFPGQPEHPEVVEAVAGVFARMAERGMAGGIYAPGPEAAERWIAAGARLVALSADVAMAMDGFRRMRAGVSCLDQPA